MTGGIVLLQVGAGALAILLAFCAIGWLFRLIDRPGWWIAGTVALWLVWELAPGSHAVMLHLWSDLQRQAGGVAQGVMKVL